MEISIIQGNEKIPFWGRVIKPWTELCAEKNIDDCEKLSLKEGGSRKSTVWILKFFTKS